MKIHFRKGATESGFLRRFDLGPIKPRASMNDRWAAVHPGETRLFACVAHHVTQLGGSRTGEAMIGFSTSNPNGLTTFDLTSGKPTPHEEAGH
jgi:hypothetical protein